MEKEFVPYTIAVILKELGFDEPCLFLYNSSDDNPKPFLANPPEPMDWNSLYVENTNKHLMSAPTFSAVFRFFREKYKLKGFISPVEYLDGTADTYHWCIYNECNSGYDQLTYEEAELACLDKLIELTFKSE